jgi:hypothetical protein
MVDDVARRLEVDSRSLYVRTLLHLPRVAGYSGLMPRWQVNAELVRVARQLAKDNRAIAALVPQGSFELRDLRFARIPAKTAEPIVSSGHYLRSVRQNSLHFALLDPVQYLPVSICSVSQMQWRRVTRQINTQFGVPGERIWEVSRVFSLHSAPPNAISYLLARVRTAFRNLDVAAELLTTAVDTNLGFTGASYRAANWQHWITVQPRPYLYHNRMYVSPRQLRQRFGTSGIADLKAMHPQQTFEHSRVRLLDSLIFCWRLRGETESVPETSLRRLHR